jgi:hypothetical protein
MYFCSQYEVEEVLTENNSVELKGGESNGGEFNSIVYMDE